MADIAPRSWRSIVFRPGRPPMRRRTAYFLCALVLLVVIIADILLLTNARVLGNIAAIQIRKHAGDVIGFKTAALTLGGHLRLEEFELRKPDAQRPVLTARRVRVSIGHREGGLVAESVVLEAPRIRFSDRIARDLAGEPDAPRQPLSDHLSSRHLPRISCRGGTLELGHSDILASEAPQIFEIRDLAMVPTTGYRYFVRGTLANALVGAWGIEGEIDLDSGDHRVHLTNDRFVLGTPIRDALRPSLREAWDKYQPSGPSAAEVLLARDAEHPDGEFRLTLKPRGMRIVYDGFPFACEDVHGEMDFRSNGFTIKQIAARNGRTARLRFDGSADGYDAAAGYHFRLEIDDAPLDDALRSALQKDAQEAWGHFKPSGRLDARVTIHRERGGPEVKERAPVDLHLKGASFTYSAFPYRIEKATGEVRIDGDTVVIKRIQGVNGPAEFTIAGRIDSVSTDAVVDLDVRALSLELNGRLRDALGKETREIFDRIGASGEIDLELRVQKSKGGEPRIRASARVKENRVLSRDVPLPILLREGTVEYNEGRVRLNHLKGVVDPAGEIEVSGDIEGSTMRLEIDGMAVPIDDRFRDRMPKSVGDILKSIQVSGIADFKFTLDERLEKEKTATRVRLSLDLRKGAISSAVPVEEIDGTVVIVGPIRDGRPMLSGRLDIRSARIVKKLVRNLRTNLSIQGSMLDFRDIGCDSYGGKISGWFSLDTVTNDLEGDFSVSRLDLRDFVNDTEKWSGKTIAGKVDLRIPRLKGKANDAASLVTGDEPCSLSITEGSLLDVPGVVNFLNPLESGGQFTAMRAFFDIKSSRFEIREFAFLKEGSGSVIGRGRFGFDGKFSLRVRTETAPIFGIKFFLFHLPGAIFDFIKTPLKVKVEGDLEGSKIFE